MQMESERNIPKERMESLLRGWWALAIDYLKRRRPQSLQDSPP
jgi:hypothetical protein